MTTQAGEGVEARVVAAALELAAEGPWEQVTLAAIAARAGVALTDLYPHLASRAAILDRFAGTIDRAVLAGDDPSLGAEPARDRLFDVLMRRFDALRPFRAGLKSIARAGRRDPLAMLGRMPGFLDSMRWMVEAAGLNATGLRGLVRRRGAAALFLAVMPTFLEDDSEDLAKTMAALDKHLTRGDRVMRRLSGGNASA